MFDKDIIYYIGNAQVRISLVHVVMSGNIKCILGQQLPAFDKKLGLGAI